MKKFLGKTLISKSDNIFVEYYILKSSNGTYGLQVFQTGGLDNGSISTVMNVTRCYSLIQKLGNLILRNKVLPISLEEVIEDFLFDEEV